MQLESWPKAVCLCPWLSNSVQYPLVKTSRCELCTLQTTKKVFCPAFLICGNFGKISARVSIACFIHATHIVLKSHWKHLKSRQRKEEKPWWRLKHICCTCPSLPCHQGVLLSAGISAKMLEEMHLVLSSPLNFIAFMVSWYQVTAKETQLPLFLGSTLFNSSVGTALLLLTANGKIPNL